MLNAFFKDLRQVRRLGPGYALRHLDRLRGAERASIQVKGVGPIHVRLEDSDADVIRQVFDKREYDLRRFPQFQRIEAAYERMLQAGQTPLVVDAGANIGLTSMWFSRMFPKARVLAVEPDPANLEICRLNVARYDNVQVVDAAIGAQSGRVDLENPEGRSFSVRTRRSDDGAVPVVTVDDLRALVDGPTGLLVVKVDIEGFEADLFAGDVSWLDDTEVLIVEPHDWMLPGARSSRSLQKALFARDFEMLIRGESLIFVR
ncbi:MAG TPA: FkbM family methyltransferase [Caulobacteraceae bacterium]|nr:FkbM family methyltransferase [Caulobacteraceae bacterium]